MSEIVVGITGASGTVYGVRLLEVLLRAGRTVHLSISPSGAEVLRHELSRHIDLCDFDAAALFGGAPPGGGALLYHHFQDFRAGIASGSFPTGGMVICPCSTGTLGALAGGLSTNLIHRAADVHLKERRRLILVPRETPLGTIPLENMHRLSVAGAVILPAMPGFYQHPESIGDLVDFVVARICDQLDVECQLTARWGDDGASRIEDRECDRG